MDAPDITQDHKAEYIRLVYEGHQPHEAAKLIGSTGTQFRRLRNPTSRSYDPVFARNYEEAINSPKHAQAFLERLRQAVWERAEAGDARLLEKLSLIYDPDWEPLKSTNFNMNVNVLARVLPHLTDEELQRAIAAEKAALEEKPLKLLPPASEQ